MDEKHTDMVDYEKRDASMVDYGEKRWKYDRLSKDVCFHDEI